jgi:hypothetical protein
MKDAAAAGLTNKDNWKKYPRNMLFARAISNGQKWYAPDVYNGVTVYTPDEMGAVVDEEGNAVIEAVAIVEKKPTLRERYAKLLETAEAAGIPTLDYQITDEMADTEITELGKALKIEVEKKAGK